MSDSEPAYPVWIKFADVTQERGSVAQLCITMKWHFPLPEGSAVPPPGAFCSNVDSIESHSLAKCIQGPLNMFGLGSIYLSFNGVHEQWADIIRIGSLLFAGVGTCMGLLILHVSASCLSDVSNRLD